MSETGRRGARNDINKGVRRGMFGLIEGTTRGKGGKGRGRGGKGRGRGGKKRAGRGRSHR